MKPLHNRVLVEENKPKEKTDSGIILSNTNTNKESIGRVIAVGDKVSSIKEGDLVMYPKNYGTSVIVDSKTLLILREQEIMATLEEVNE